MLILYYLIGFPLMIYTTYSRGLGWGVKGIWLSFGLVNAFLSVIYMYKIYYIDWEESHEQSNKKV